MEKISKLLSHINLYNLGSMQRSNYLKNIWERESKAQLN